MCFDIPVFMEKNKLLLASFLRGLRKQYQQSKLKVMIKQIRNLFCITFCI